MPVLGWSGVEVDNNFDFKCKAELHSFEGYYVEVIMPTNHKMCWSFEI